MKKREKNNKYEELCNKKKNFFSCRTLYRDRDAFKKFVVSSSEEERARDRKFNWVTLLGYYLFFFSLGLFELFAVGYIFQEVPGPRPTEGTPPDKKLCGTAGEGRTERASDITYHCRFCSELFGCFGYGRSSSPRSSRRIEGLYQFIYNPVIRDRIKSWTHGWL